MVKLRRVSVAEKYEIKSKNITLEARKDVDDLKAHLGDDLFDDYMKIRDRIADPEWKNFEILKNKDIEEIKDYVDNFQSESDKRKKAKEGAKKIYSDEEWNVFRITTYPAAQYYGKGTKWCITGRYAGHEDRGETYFNDYIKAKNLDGGYYFYINKKNPTKKYCVLQKKDKTIASIWDANDNMEGVSMASLNVQLPEIPEVNLRKDYTIDGLCDLCSRTTTDIEYLEEYIENLKKKEGKDILNKQDSIGRTPLNQAIGTNNYDLVKLLIDAGADVSYKDNDGRSPLYIAISKGNTTGINVDIIKLLIKNKAKVSNDLIDSIIKILRYGNIENNVLSSVLKLLVKNGADVNVKNWYGKYNLHQLIEMGKLDAIKIFVKNGADVNASDSFGITPLLKTIIEDNIENQKDILKFLIQSGADVNKIYSGGSTALINCCKDYKKNKNTLALVKLLVENGANVNDQDSHGNTALHYAIQYSDTPQIVKYLIENGADMDIENDAGFTPINQSMIQPKVKKYLSSIH